MKPVLFIDRDGTLINEVPPTYQIDSFEKLEFYPEVFSYLSRIAAELDFELVMISNQDGLGTESFPEKDFYPVQDFILQTLAGEGIEFADIIIDRTFARDNQPTRKPGTALLGKYIQNPQYDLAGSFVIGDRITDVQLAANLGCKAIWLNNEDGLGADETKDKAALETIVALSTKLWSDIYNFLKLKTRRVCHERNTNETKISVELNLDGKGEAAIHTGLGFFDHMLEQIARHGNMDLTIQVAGDLHIDEHHTIEDTGIALGEAFALLLSDKRGMERYGFALPMDEAQAQVLIDFGGRSWTVWDAEFKRE
ncbi:MAG TPA: histidinol-phosphatase, partial [Arachidicoccus sp.]|nr:histidinol-phosphatase [Arachidicoccus sp.]